MQTTQTTPKGIQKPIETVSLSVRGTEEPNGVRARASVHPVATVVSRGRCHQRDEERSNAWPYGCFWNDSWHHSTHPSTPSNPPHTAPPTAQNPERSSFREVLVSLSSGHHQVYRLVAKTTSLTSSARAAEHRPSRSLLPTTLAASTSWRRSSSSLDNE